MQSPWIREASKACCSSSGCCPNPFLGFPHYVEASSSSSKPQSAAVSRYQFEVSTTSSLYPHFHFTNHESLPSYHESFACFNKVYPQYSQTDEADKIRASEYPHLDSSVACFDYIGHGLFSYSQLQGSPFFDICCSTTNVGIVSLVPPLKLESPKGKAPLHEIEEIIDSRTSNTLQCKALDHADSLGLVLISSRTRSLINWLVNALMSLQHPHSETGIPAVKIYGPKVMFDRGPAVAFNVFDWKGERIHPALVQKLADRNNISLSIGCLQHIWFSDKHEEMKEKDKFQPGIDVVTAAIGYLTNFEDIYRLWVFVSRFLDADFLDKEKWRYKALNQRTIEI
ncbi:hypothetical protein ES288_D03G192100v1 [Gossypium darwinii]|uniref:Uncharacterized protein n=1 Tax=Gossypium darwinii TaxID=34276 RepID=A0A5D2D9P6_GOSDA|nr:hypothetical protein ES288_D03G192100v1 [Gossypium darwinii]